MTVWSTYVLLWRCSNTPECGVAHSRSAGFSQPLVMGFPTNWRIVWTALRLMASYNDERAGWLGACHRFCRFDRLHSWV